MENPKKLFIFVLSTYFSISNGQDVDKKSNKKLLFVFGDSYVDTGNWNKDVPGPWKSPYGITFPGKPAGRFSDGRCLTDYIASYLGTRSPLPYQWRQVRKDQVKYGMNFAYGGTGVFNTLVKEPNMTTQIDFFEQQIKDKLYTKHDVESSIAWVTLAGNDYGTYDVRNGSQSGLPAFSISIIQRLAVNLERIHRLGVKKVALTTMEPTGCLPISTSLNAFTYCNETQNGLARFHNEILHEAVKKLNDAAESKDENSPTFVIFDLYSAFMSALTEQGSSKESLKYKHSLKPCCLRETNRGSCGSINAKGEKIYKLCKKPKSVFFWDMFHPSQMGWHAIYKALRPSLHKLH